MWDNVSVELVRREEKIMCKYCKKGIDLKNTHFKKLPIVVVMIKDKTRCGLTVYDRGTAIGVYEIAYCPICGNKV